MYYKLWPDLLEAIRASYLRESDIEASEFAITDEKVKIKRRYSLNNYCRNFMYEPEQKHRSQLGVEKEIEELAYIASRKVLSFNLFGNDSTVFKSNSLGIAPGKYEINYMQRMPVIRGKNSSITTDVFLYNRESEELIVSRVRFLEWIILKNDAIKEQYLDSSYYLYQSAGNVFPEVIKKLLSVCSGDNLEYSGKYYNFDSLHVIKEIIAAYNLLYNHPEYKNLNKLIIAEIYWKPVFYESLDQYAGRVYLKEKNRINEAQAMMGQITPVIKLFEKEFGVTLDIKCIDMWNMLLMQKKTKDELRWMRRFVI